MFEYLNKRRKKGQSTLEYAILIIIILGALLSIQVYIKRGIQGRFKSAADDIGDQFSVGNQNYTSNTYSNSYTAETFTGGVTRSELLADEISNEIVDSEVINVEREFWGND